jgi:hypothetical protein
MVITEVKPTENKESSADDDPDEYDDRLSRSDESPQPTKRSLDSSKPTKRSLVTIQSNPRHVTLNGKQSQREAEDDLVYFNKHSPQIFKTGLNFSKQPKAFTTIESSPSDKMPQHTHEYEQVSPFNDRKLPSKYSVAK